MSSPCQLWMDEGLLTLPAHQCVGTLAPIGHQAMVEGEAAHAMQPGLINWPLYYQCMSIVHY